MAAGAENAVGKGAVICQQHKAGGVLIQPPGENSPLRLSAEGTKSSTVGSPLPSVAESTLWVC